MSKLRHLERPPGGARPVTAISNPTLGREVPDTHICGPESRLRSRNAMVSPRDRVHSNGSLHRQLRMSQCLGTAEETFDRELDRHLPMD